MEERLKKLEAEAEIARILVEYATALDARDFATYVNLFTPDGEWAGGFGRFQGREAIEAMLVEHLGRPGPGFVNVSSFHSVANPLVNVTGDTATASSLFLVWVRNGEDPPQPKPVLAGRYVDELVKTAVGWKIARRTAHDMMPFKDPHDPALPDPGRKPGPPVLSIEARLRKVEDELAIRRALVEYGARLDARDIDGYVQVFARDGTWQNEDQIYRGHAQLRQLLIDQFGGVPEPDYLPDQGYLIIHNPQVDVDGDRAKVRSRHTLMWRDETGHPKPMLAGIYEDEFIREDGEWKILYRRDNPVIPSRNDWEDERVAALEASLRDGT